MHIVSMCKLMVPPCLGLFSDTCQSSGMMQGELSVFIRSVITVRTNYAKHLLLSYCCSYTKYSDILSGQTVETLIRLLLRRSLIWVCTVWPDMANRLVSG